MRPKASSKEAMIRRAFGLLLEIRRHPDAARRLGIALAVLETLVCAGDADAHPVVVAIRAMPMRRA